MNRLTLDRKYVSQNALPHWHFAASKEIFPFFDVSTFDEFRMIYPDIENEIHSHDFYTIVWISQGVGICKSNLQSFDVEKNTILFFAPRVLYKLENFKNMKGIAIAFSEDFLLHLDQNILVQIKYRLFFNNSAMTSCHVKDSVRRKLEDLMSNIKKEFNEGRKDELHTSYLASLFSQFLFTIERECIGDDIYIDPHDSAYQTFLAFKNKVEDHFHETHIVKDYAEMMNVSLNVLSDATHKYAKISPLKMINGRVALEAKRMMQYSPLRVKEISATLGFEDVSYFVKFFRHNIGMTPEEFRKIKDQ